MQSCSSRSSHSTWTRSVGRAVGRFVVLVAVCGSMQSVGWAAEAGSGAEDVAVVAVPVDGRTFAARTDAAGTIHVLVDTDDGPLYLASKDDGKTFGKPIAVVDRASRKPGLKFTPWDVAVSPDGHVHVAMGTNGWKLKLPKEEWAFHYARLAPGDAAFSPVRNLNRHPSEGYSLAADAKGNVTACWLSDKLYANVSHDGGKTFSATVEIDPSLDPCNCCTTSAAYAADGRLAVLYREETNDERDMYLVLWDQSGKAAARTRVSGAPWKIDGCPMTYYSIAPRGEGFVAAWPTKGEIYFVRLDKRGEVLSPGEVKTPGRLGTRTGVTALAGQNGGTLVAWKADGRLHWQLYDDECRAVGRTGSAESPGEGVAAVRSKRGGFVLLR